MSRVKLVLVKMEKCCHNVADYRTQGRKAAVVLSAAGTYTVTRIRLGWCPSQLQRFCMDSTSVSLLRRLHTDEKEIAWERFVELYAPLIYHWTLRAGLSGDDAADCVQNVLKVLVDQLPTFIYDPKKNFRAWLRTVTVNKCRDTLRHNATVVQSAIRLGLEDAVSADGVELFTDQEYHRSLVHRAMELMQTEFEPKTWQACW